MGENCGTILTSILGHGVRRPPLPPPRPEGHREMMQVMILFGSYKANLDDLLGKLAVFCRPCVLFLDELGTLHASPHPLLGLLKVHVLVSSPILRMFHFGSINLLDFVDLMTALVGGREVVLCQFD